jgi:hypothetical protein
MSWRYNNFNLNTQGEVPNAEGSETRQMFCPRFQPSAYSVFPANPLAAGANLPGFLPAIQTDHLGKLLPAAMILPSDHPRPVKVPPPDAFYQIIYLTFPVAKCVSPHGVISAMGLEIK